MLFQITQICLNKSDHVTLHSIMNVMTKNGAKMTHEMRQYRFYGIIIWHMSGKGYYKHTRTEVVVWLSCYAYIFAI